MQLKCYTGSISVADFRHRTLKRFVAICTTLPWQLLRPEVRKSQARIQDFLIGGGWYSRPPNYTLIYYTLSDVWHQIWQLWWFWLLRSGVASHPIHLPPWIRPWIAWYFYSVISTGWNGNFGGKTGRISDCRVCSFWKIEPMSQGKFVQFVQNRNIVKTRFVFPIKDRNVGSNSAALSCLVSWAPFPNSSW